MKSGKDLEDDFANLLADLDNVEALVSLNIECLTGNSLGVVDNLAVEVDNLYGSVVSGKDGDSAVLSGNLDGIEDVEDVLDSETKISSAGGNTCVVLYSPRTKSYSSL